LSAHLGRDKLPGSPSPPVAGCPRQEIGDGDVSRETPGHPAGLASPGESSRLRRSLRGTGQGRPSQCWFQTPGMLHPERHQPIPVRSA